MIVSDLVARYASLFQASATVAVNVLVQSAVLTAAGIVAARCFRRRGAAVESAVLRATLVAVLLVPLASWVLAAAGVNGLRVSLPQATAAAAPIVKTIEPVPQPAPRERAPFADFEPTGPALDNSDERQIAPTSPLARPPIGTTPTVADTGVARLAQAAGPPRETTSTITVIYAVSAAVWYVVAGLLLARLAGAHLLMSLTRRRARPADAATLETCRGLATALGVKPPAVLLTSRLASPCLVGWWRPAILLPDVGSNLLASRPTARVPRRKPPGDTASVLPVSVDVLVHELAHLARRDALWNLIGRVAASALWFQPLLTLLVRRDEQVADDVCDDFVVAHGADRADYAAELVEVAGRFQADWPLATAGVGIVTFRSSLGRRVQRILDTSRALSTRTSRATLLAIVLAGAMGTCLSGWLGAGANPVAAEPQADPAKDAAATPTAAAAQIGGAGRGTETRTVSGNVVDRDGRPLAGAAVYIAEYVFDPDPPREVTKTDTGGRFRFSFDQPQYHERVRAKPDMFVIAVADGYAADWDHLHNAGDKLDVLLRLPEEKIIQGRVLDPDGRPLPGAELRVQRIESYSRENMALCLDDVANGRRLLQWCRDGGPLPRQPAKIVTAADGRFRLGGIGPDTVVELHVRGPGIHHTTFEATTAVSDTLRGPVSGPDPPLRARPARVLYGANCEYLATPARTIAGVVRDLATGEPVAGANVRSAATTFIATTDREGRYELLGCKKEADYRIRVQPPDDGPAYFFAELELADAPGLGPLVQDIGLVRGIAMQGRVVDSVTGLPLPTRVHYEPLPRNLHAAALVERPADLNGYADCRADGTWRIVVAPGPGALRFDFPSVDPECYAPITTTYEEVVKLYEQSPEHRPLAHLPDLKDEFRFSHVIGFLGSARVVLISPADGAAPEPLEVQLERGRTLDGQVVGPDGKALAGVIGYGLNNACIGSRILTSGKFAVTALRPGVRREIGFHHKEKRLGAYRVIDGGESERLVVPLEPCGVAVGRILDEQGAPVAAMDVWFYPVLEARRRSEVVFAVTDANGRFRTDELVPGQPYEVDRSGPGGSIFRSLYGGGFSVGSGQTKDLGDVTLGGKPKPATKADTDDQADANEKPKSPPPQIVPKGGDDGNAAAKASESVTVRGRVLDPDSKSLAGAKLYLSYPNRNNLEPRLLGASGAEGQFEFRVDKSQLDTSYMRDPWSMASITATAEGFGLEWVDVAKPDGDGNLIVRLVNDVPIHGRVLTLEGRPVAGAKVRLRQISIPEHNLDAFVESLRMGAGASGVQRVRAKLPGVPDEIVADAEGRWTLRGLGAERLVELAVEAPGIEWASIWIMTRECEPVDRAHGAQMSPQPKRAYGAAFEYLAPPARPIVGTVRDHETGEPVAGARVRGRNMNFTKSDEDGRFELAGEPKVKRHFIEVMPGGLPYFAASLQIDDTPGFEPLTVEIEVHRGITARGRVTAQPSGAPNQAQVDYYPLLPNQHIAKLGPRVAQGGHGQSSAECGPDGAYTLPVLPGPGVLAFRAGPVSRDYYQLYAPAFVNRQDLQEFFHESADRFFPKGIDALPDGSSLPTAGGGLMSQTNFNQLVLINPAEDAQELTQDAKIVVGRTVTGRVEGPDREPLAGVLVRGLDNSLSEPGRLETPEFNVLALNPRRRRVLIFEHRERRLGFHTDMVGDEPGPLVVRLQPCGALVGRLLDAEGEPLARSVISVARHRIGSPEFTVTTDAEGRFRAEGLVPGLKYDLLREREPGIMGRRFVADGVAVAAGETKDLGDRAIKPPATPPRNEKPKPGTEQPGQPKPKDESQPKPPRRVEGDNPGAAKRTIVGTIRDRTTGKPIAAVKVVFQDRLAGGFPAPFGGSGIAAEDETDDQGRYELVEVAKGKQYSVMVLPEGLPYFGASAQLADAPGVGPLTADFELRSGIPAEGRVTVRPTGEPNPARVEYFPLKPNFNVAGLGPFERDQPWASATCRADGSYTVPVLPGPGVLAFRAARLGQDDQPFFAPAFVTRQDLEDFFHLDADKFFYEWHSAPVNLTLPVASARSGNASEILQTAYNQLVLINPARDAESLAQDATFEVGRTTAGSLQGPDGEPLEGATVIGLDDTRSRQVDLATPEFTVLALHPRRTRELVFEHQGRNLGAQRTIRGDDPGPLVVRLEARGALVGRLIDPAGQPLAENAITLHRWSIMIPKRPVTTDGDGKFRIEGLVPAMKYGLTVERRFVVEQVTVAAGETKDVGDLKAEARAPAVTREPVMIRGRVLDLEGRPAVGAKVRVAAVHWPVAADGGSLDKWLAAVQDAKDFQEFNRAYHERLNQQHEAVAEAVNSELMRYPFVTGDDGRFEFDAGGAERVLNLIIEGDGLASTYCQVMTRPGAPIHVPAHSRDEESMYLNPPDDVIVYGATFEHVATPGCRIEGVVRDRATGEPVAGVTVRAERRNELDGALGRFRSTTDTLGRYQLLGVPTRVKPTPIVALSGPDRPYLTTTLEADLEYARDVVKLDFALARGAWVEGRVADKETGEGVKADVSYFVWADNPHLLEGGRRLGQDAFRVKTSKDGTYRVLAFPGRGVIAVRANSQDYAFGIGAGTIDGPNYGDIGFRTAPHVFRPGEFHTVVGFESAVGAESVQCDVQVDPGLRRTGTVVDSDGQPLEGAQMIRILNRGGGPLVGSQFTIEHLAPGETRTVLFEHQARRLIVLAKIAAEGDEPLVVALEPWATVSGRVVGEEGVPRADVQVVALEPPIPQVKVSQDGRFTIERLIPGVKYQFRPSVKNKLASLPLARDVVLKPGETRDLGDVVMKSPK